MARKPRSLQDHEFLHKLYAKFNKKYFGNALPKDPQIQIVPHGKLGIALGRGASAACMTMESEDPNIPPLDPIVEISAFVMEDRGYALVNMMHEMIHLAVGKKEAPGSLRHGREYRALARKISKMGALIDII